MKRNTACRHRCELISSAPRHIVEPLERRMLLSISPVGPEFRVNSVVTSSQRDAAVAIDGVGNFVVAWESVDQDGSGYGIYSQRYDAAGAAQGPEFRVNSFTTNHQYNPSVAMDADGDFVVAWQSFGQDGSDYGVFAQRYNAVGAAQGPEFRVNSYTSISQVFPSVAMDADGDFVVAWASGGQDGSVDGIYAQRYNASGAAQGLEFRVNSFTTGGQTAPSVAVDASGDYVIAWADGAQDGSGTGIYGQRFNSSGVAQGGEFRVNTFTTGSQTLPSAAMDAGGDFVVAWQSFFQDGSGTGIYAQRYDAAGVAQGVEFQVNSFTPGTQRAPSLAMDADGDFVVTWGSYGQDGSGTGIYAQRYDAAGVAQGVEFRVNSFTTNTQRDPSVAMDDHGDLVVAWESFGQDGSSDGVFAQRYAVVPAVAGSSFLFETTPHRVEYTFDENVGASLGTDDILLENLTTMQTIPSGDLSLSYDSHTDTATFSYVGPGGSLIGGVLPDGNYRATLLAAGITTPNGMPLPANHVFNFFFLNGDANHDATVNLRDFDILVANFGQSPRDFTQGDFNYDATVNLLDFDILAGRFGRLLTVPTSSSHDGVAGAAFTFGSKHIAGDRWIEDLA